MSRINKLLVVFASACVITFATNGVEAYAQAKAAKTETSKKTTVSRRNTYARGSGSYVKEGDPAKVIEYAKRFLGVKYVFGGMSSKGFDCSGFTSYAYKALGVNLPHTASGQSTYGVAVTKDKLEAGDLVFFETYKNEISHVGIYIGGDKFIHASSGGKRVMVTNLSDDYYVARYRGATRVLN
jgi:cell wall-associated NlpC family hydrolase